MHLSIDLDMLLQFLANEVTKSTVKGQKAEVSMMTCCRVLCICISKFNPLKCSGVRQLHLKVFSSIQV